MKIAACGLALKGKSSIIVLHSFICIGSFLLSSMLSAAVFLTIVECSLIATAFSTNRLGRLRSPRRVPMFYNSKTEEVIADKNAREAEYEVKENPSKDKAAIIFLHGLGDSPDGWASLAEALPNLRPSLANLDITYVFPPAQMVGITVNGGEKMPGGFARLWRI